MKSIIAKLIATVYQGVVRGIGSLLFPGDKDNDIVSGGGSDAGLGGEERNASQTFADAMAYARKRSTDAAYQQKAELNHTTAYNVALADYLNPPAVYHLDPAAYDGRAGDVIYVEATDDFQVVSVEVKIVDGRGYEVEEGEAQFVDGFTWRYVAITVNTSVAGTIIYAYAYDKAGGSGLASTQGGLLADARLKQIAS